MKTKRSQEGYVLLDNTASGGSKFESATITCSHCQQIVVLNPKRTRERGFCRKCDHYICDHCTDIMATTLECVPYKKIMDVAQERAFLNEQRSGLIIVR